MAKIRLDKFLADVGAGTRTIVKKKIRQGSVEVNKEECHKADRKIDTDVDVVTLDGKIFKHEEFQYYMLNKPAGVVSATKDSSNKTVIELITGNKRRDLFPVGRLDKDTEGLLVITNDGLLANNLLSPRKHVSKKYFVRVSGKITEETVSLFQEGLDIGDDKLTLPATLCDIAIIDDNISETNIIITEGRYHQVKRMFEAVGMEVVYLKRLSMGGLDLDKTLSLGENRRLTDEEIEKLKKS